MFEIILFVVFAVIIWRIITSYRLKTFDTVLAFTGGLGSGKTFLSVQQCRRLLRRKRFRVKVYNYFHPKTPKPQPLLYSSIPVRVSKTEMAVKLTAEHLLLQKQIVLNSVVFIDEVGGFCSQFDYKVTNTDLFDEFVRFFRHYVQGYLIVNDQCSENIVLQVRRRLNTVYNLMGFRTFLKLIYWVRVRNISVSEEIKTIEEQNTEDNMKLLFGFLPTFRAYDTHCYYCRYASVPSSVEQIHVSMSMMDILRISKQKLTAKTGLKAAKAPTSALPLPPSSENQSRQVRSAKQKRGKKL